MKPKSLKHFNENINRIFDIIACTFEMIKCGEGPTCRRKEECSGFHVLCLCPHEKKIPDNEVMYVKDQKEKVGLLGSQMVVGGRDKATEGTSKHNAEKERKEEEKGYKRAAEAAKEKKD